MINPRGIMQQIPMLRIAVMLIIGICIGNTLIGIIHTIEWLIITAIVAVLAILSLNKATLGSRMLFLTYMCIGITLASIHDSLREDTDNEEHCYEGIIISTPTKHGKVHQCDVIIMDADRELKTKASIINGENLKVGDVLEMTTSITPPHNFINSKFNYAQWLRLQGYCGVIFLPLTKWHKKQNLTNQLSISTTARVHLLAYRESIINKLQHSGLSEDAMPVIAAMALGDKRMIDKAERELFSQAGVSHILALSGLHIGIIMTMLLSLMYFQRRTVIQLMAITAVWLFVMLVGMPVSAVRAALMLTIWFAIRTFLKRKQNPLNILGTAIIVLILINPYVVYDISFQLSVIAVFAILIASPYITGNNPFMRKTEYAFLRNHKITRKVLEWTWNLTGISIVAQIATAPITVYLFGQYPTFFLLSNFIVIPLATLIIYTTLVLMLLTSLGFTGTIVASIDNTFVWILNKALEVINALPMASIEININKLQMFLLYIFIIGVVYLLSFFIRKPIHR